MQFQVPQFIEVEDKIFGPLTFKQFVYLAGGGGIAFVLYKILPLFLAILIIVPVVGLALALSFYKINNKPFITMLESATRYAGKGKLYIWKKSNKKPEQVIKNEAAEVAQMQLPKLSDSKLKDIAWSLGVKDSVYADQVNQSNKENNGSN